MSELVAGQRFYQFDLSSAPDFLTADNLQCVSTQPATVVMQFSRHTYETHTIASVMSSWMNLVTPSHLNLYYSSWNAHCGIFVTMSAILSSYVYGLSWTQHFQSFAMT